MPPHIQLLDPRCLEHDHHFSDLDLYDDDGQPFPDQIKAKCTRCGITMGESLQRIMAECHAYAEGKLQ